jgi:MFS family permease
MNEVSDINISMKTPEAFNIEYSDARLTSRLTVPSHSTLLFESAEGGPIFSPSVAINVADSTHLLKINELDDLDDNSKDSEGKAVENSGEDLTRSKSRYRWMILFLCLLIIMGPYYAYDNPSATQAAMSDYFNIPTNLNSNSTSFQNITKAEFVEEIQLMYSVYSVPNTILPLFGGVFVDKLGYRTMLIITSVLALFGQVVVSIGLLMQSWIIMYVGRVIFGVGTESMTVALRILVTAWFSNSGELGIALASIVAAGRLGSVFNDLISGLCSCGNVIWAYWIGSFVCFISVLAAMMALSIDKQFDRSNDESKKSPADENISFSLIALSAFFTYVYATILELPLSYWLFCVAVIAGFPPFTCFNGVASAFLIMRWTQINEDNSTIRANMTMGIMYTVAGILAPFSGYFVDKVIAQPTSIVLIVASSLGFASISHFMLLFSSVPPELAIAGLGLSFAFFSAAAWPAVICILPKHRRIAILGIAYGLLSSLQNVGLALVPILIGKLQPPACSNSFFCVETMFASIAAIAACFAIGTIFAIRTSDVKAGKRKVSAQDGALSYSLLSDSDGGTI